MGREKVMWKQRYVERGKKLRRNEQNVTQITARTRHGRREKQGWADRNSVIENEYENDDQREKIYLRSKIKTKLLSLCIGHRCIMR